jgi:hypothetical protein
LSFDRSSPHRCISTPTSLASPTALLSPTSSSTLSLLRRSNGTTPFLPVRFFSWTWAKNNAAAKKEKRDAYLKRPRKPVEPVRRLTPEEIRAIDIRDSATPLWKSVSLTLYSLPEYSY